MYNDFESAAKGQNENVPSHPVLDSEIARARAKLFAGDVFAEQVQTLLGNGKKVRHLQALSVTREGLSARQWAELKNLKSTAMDKDLFRKVCRTAIALELIPEDETSLAGLLPNKAGKIGDNWAVPSPDNCAKILNVFSKINPTEKKEVSGWDREQTEEEKARARLNFGYRSNSFRL